MAFVPAQVRDASSPREVTERRRLASRERERSEGIRRAFEADSPSREPAPQPDYRSKLERRRITPAYPTTELVSPVSSPLSRRATTRAEATPASRAAKRSAVAGKKPHIVMFSLKTVEKSPSASRASTRARARSSLDRPISRDPKWFMSEEATKSG